MKRLHKKMTRLAVVIGVSLMVSACSDHSMDDLTTFVNDVKAKQSGSIAPLPVVKPVETFVYSAMEIKDPFKSWEDNSTSVSLPKMTNTALSGEESRERDALEAYPLDTLRMIGALLFKGEKWGLIKAPDGIIYRVKRGDHMGHNFGKVSYIEDEKIVLIEIVQDGLGGWEERQASLALGNE